MITLTSFEMDLWKDVCARCVAAEMASSAAAKKADEVVEEFRKRFSDQRKELVQKLLKSMERDLDHRTGDEFDQTLTALLDNLREDRPGGPSGMNGKVELITPERAQTYIANRHPNTRAPVYEKWHLKFAEMMENGQWDPMNGNPVMFDQWSRMIDGVQRMAAVVLCGRPIEMLVLRKGCAHQVRGFLKK